MSTIPARTFRLPKERQDLFRASNRERNPVAEQPIVIESRATGRILVVEDEPFLREVTRELLEDAGCQVVTCANGREALAALQSGVFDAVLSDVRMPDMDGIGLLRAVREQDLDVPIVLMTGAPTLETAIEAVEQGALQYLVKPVPLQALLESSRRAVRLGTLARLKREALQTIGLEQVAGDRAGAEASFARALEELWIAYQPIVHSDDGSLFGHEALLRAADSYPGPVLTLAERLGRLPDLGARIRDEVAAQLDANPGDELMFVNLHPMDLGDDALLNPHAALSRHASRVVLEVTERASLEGLRGVGERIRALRTLGYRIALDDLGAGYAGLTSFATLAPDFVKLDRALMRDLDRHPIKRKLVDSMARLCADMNVRVVAEGIETDGERDGAIQAGCDLLQGFLIGSPSKLTPP